MPSIADLLSTPDHYLWGFEGEAALFLDMDRAAYARSLFLDDRIQPKNTTPLGVRIDPLLAAGGARPIHRPPLAWIFHIAHCGSTLLARALDLPDRSLVLREPYALRQLAVAAAQSPGGQPGDDWQQGLELILSLLARRYRTDAPVIVKANVPVNFVLPSLPGPDILLHLPLDEYLLATLRTDAHRQWLRRVCAELRPAMEAIVGRLPESDASSAAALWVSQVLAFDVHLTSHPHSRSLAATVLFETPAAVLHASAALFGVALNASEIEAIAAGPLFSSHGKNPSRPFTNAERLERQAAARTALRAELEQAHHWLDSAAFPLPAALARPLTGDPVLLRN